ncbi:DsbA family protein [Roseicyclus sp. F158]|uniref:DsbA family protein n=1 Tax=Tropicimonas omnivorans TaxID=3075590 RepID=A0ABU3DDP2_9RHOB|nr:DsbA family protein [Roseicyclus sp. F158]MDT0681832.1 DsbA family protein [Roseicyclus sp. F158]
MTKTTRRALLGAPFAAAAFAALPAWAQDAETEDATASAAPEIAEMAMGEADAPVTIYEFASFTCPHCASFHLGPLKQLKENYVDTGKVRLVYRDVYFDRPGLWAAMMARCGGQMRFFGIADMLYQNQRDWLQGEPTQIVENLKAIGREAGIGNDKLDACLQDGETAEALFAWYEEGAEENNIQGTPSFVIDGQTYSNMSYDDFAELLDEKLES